MKDIKSWWQREVKTLSIRAGFTIKRRTVALVLVFWVLSFSTGSLLWVRGLDGYSMLTGVLMCLVGSQVAADVSKYIKD